MASNKQVAIDPGLFDWPSEKPRLFGSECQNCGEITFPRQDNCPKCSSASCEKIEIASKGILYTWTSQEFRPKFPYKGDDTDETFQPYYLGYVELPGQVRVESRLDVDDPAKLRIGMEMELRIVKFRSDDEGNDIMMFAFAPVS